MRKCLGKRHLKSHNIDSGYTAHSLFLRTSNMDAHSCRHCESIVIDLPDPDDFYTSVSSTLIFDVGRVKSAVQDRCLFFQWALNIDVENLPTSDRDQYLDDHIANLPGTIGEEEDSDDGGSDSDCTQDLNYEGVSSNSYENNDVSVTDFRSSLDVDGSAPRQMLRLHVESSGMKPHRCFLIRDAARGDAPRPRLSIYWDGPQLDLVVPRGTYRSPHTAVNRCEGSRRTCRKGFTNSGQTAPIRLLSKHSQSSDLLAHQNHSEELPPGYRLV